MEMKSMARDLVYQALQNQGVARVVIHYHGGNDEGMAEAPEFYDSEGKICESVDLSPTLEDYLEQPIEDDLGSAWYDGAEEQSGTLVWHVDERTVILHHGYPVWQYDPPKEV